MHVVTPFADATLTIDLDAIAGNYRLLKERAAPAECAAVVKANAYGLGVEYVAPRLFQEGCHVFFVATLDEGITLRQILPEAEIIIFHGVKDGEAKIFEEYGLIPVLNDLYQIEIWEKTAEDDCLPLPAILHIDTGMTRLALTLTEEEDLIQHRDRIKALNILYLMSHLACISTPKKKKNKEQLRLLEGVRKHFPDLKVTLANSGGVMAGKEYHFDLVRPGASLYGVHTIEAQRGLLQNVATLKARIIKVRQIKSKSTVGYSATESVPKGSVLATVPVGYADGYMRSISGKGKVWVGGMKVPVVGRVSMDMIVIDVTKVSSEYRQVGCEVELMGPNITVDDVADAAGTIGYEILTRLGSRLHRIYVNQGQSVDEVAIANEVMDMPEIDDLAEFEELISD